MAETQGYTGTNGSVGEIFEGKTVLAPEKKSQVASIARGFIGALAGIKVQAPVDETFKKLVSCLRYTNSAITKSPAKRKHGGVFVPAIIQLS